MKYLIIIICTMLILMGCNESSNIINPVIENNDTNLSKITEVEYDLIPLPPKSPEWQDSIFTISQVIDGEIGGRMIMDKYYIDANGDSVMMFADLRIPAGAFLGSETITMTVDNEYAFLHFYPEMVFEDTLRLFNSFRNLDLNDYSTGTIDFVFIGEDGTIELIKRNGLQVNIPQGFIRVQNAKLLHFSRYGFIRSPMILPLQEKIIVD
jgi:hypothetical protein